MLPVEEDSIDRSRGEWPETEPVTHLPQLGPYPGWHGLVERESTRLRLVRAERAPNLIARDIGRFHRLLHVHPELHDVEEKLQQILILAVASLYGKRQERFPVFERHARRQGGPRPLARLDDVERVLGFVEHETLHALTHPDAGAARQCGRNPAAARCDRDDPTVGVSGLNGCRTREKTFLERHVVVLRTLRRGRRNRMPVLQQVEIRVLLSFKRIGISGLYVRIVPLPVDLFETLASVIL